MGFPYLVYLDAAGDVLAKHEGQRSVEGFEETAGEALKFAALKEKAAGGDKKAMVQVFLRELDMGTIPMAEAKKHLKELEGTDVFGELVDDEMAAKIQQQLVNLEFQGVLETLSDVDPADRKKVLGDAAKAMYAMKEKGRIPDSRMSPYFWQIMLGYAQQENDTKMLLDVAQDWKKRLDPESRRDQRMIEQLDRLIEKAKSDGK